MDAPERIRLLRSVELFSALPEEKLGPLAALLERVTVEDGRPFLSEGEKSDGLYFLLSGRARVAKRLADGGEKDLSFVGPGQCLGEMELLRGDARSASAYAQGRLELLRLTSRELRRWLESEPALAARFFEKLAEIQSERLRRTSDEVAMLYDLSQLLAAPQSSEADLLSRALERVASRLPGRWSSEARVYDSFEDEMDLVSRFGRPIGEDGPEKAPATPADVSWTDDRTLLFVLRAPKRLLGLLRFRVDDALDEQTRAECARVLGAAARLLASALENLHFRTDEELRQRLHSRSNGPSL